MSSITNSPLVVRRRPTVETGPRIRSVLMAKLQAARARRAEKRAVDAWLFEHAPSEGRATGCRC